MINGNICQMKELDKDQDMEYIEKAILNVFKKQKVSLSQARVIFNHLLRKIEDENIINL